ncbi:hypothetical protein MMC13_004654 [Lambiella insularis]|nr:hypothetical protein [Lambiella insularis]
MRITALGLGIMLAMIAFAEAGQGGRGGDTKGGDTKGGNAGQGGKGGKGGDSKGGSTKGGASTAKGGGGAGGSGGSAETGLGGSSGSQSTTVGGTTYVFEGDTFGAGTTIGGGQMIGGQSGSGGDSGAAFAGSGAAGGGGPKSGSGGSSGNGGKAGPGGGGGNGGGSGGGGAGPGGASGNGGGGGKGGDMSIPVSVTPVPRRRARDLFVREPWTGESLYAREETDGQLFVRAGKTTPAKGGAAKSGAAKSGKVNELGQITEPEFVRMINAGDKFPEKLEQALASSPLSKIYKAPANRKPCPTDLANHPAEHAIQILKAAGSDASKLPPSIKVALDKNWKKSGANGADGKSAKGASAAGKAGASGKGAAPKKGGKRDVMTYDDFEIYTRSAYPELGYYDSELFARDAYPEAFYEDSELYARDADFDAYYGDFDIYARDAEAEADFDLYARDAEPEARKHVEAVSHMSQSDMTKLFQALETNPEAQKAVLKAVNADPYLAHYAHELEEDFE